ncbi:MAG TPA: hypothetical protein VFG64_13065 [Dongiaceae bacterium]|jgi:hypothetical protein|nr:hypothetical protein [Dongiaceae bacterium]
MNVAPGEQRALTVAVLVTLERGLAPGLPLGAAARRWAERNWPSWREVLEQDLLPVWRSAAEIGRSRVTSR